LRREGRKTNFVPPLFLLKEKVPGDEVKKEDVIWKKSGKE